MMPKLKHAKKVGLRAMTLALGGAMLLPGMSAFAASMHTATKTTTYWTLSNYYGIPVAQLKQANPTIHENNIYPGLKLTIPTVAASPSASDTRVMSAKSTATATIAAKSIETDASGSLSYSKVIDMKASAYSASAQENAWGAVDYFGNALKLGTIAVDPKVVPLGTKVYITGYSFAGLPEGGMIATASDAGSAIVGNRVDIFVPGSPSQAKLFGYQQVKLYVLK